MCSGSTMSSCCSWCWNKSLIMLNIGMAHTMHSSCRASVLTFKQCCSEYSELSNRKNTAKECLLIINKKSPRITKKPAVARKDALQPIQFLLQYWPSSSSKVNDVSVIWKPICDFLLVINNNLSSVSYRSATTGHTDLQGHLKSI